MKTTICIIIYCLCANFAKAQHNESEFQSNPKLVLKEVFKAAKTKDYSNLKRLCPIDGSNDSDTQKYICDIATASTKSQNDFVNWQSTLSE